MRRESEALKVRRESESSMEMTEISLELQYFVNRMYMRCYLGTMHIFSHTHYEHPNSVYVHTEI